MPLKPVKETSSSLNIQKGFCFVEQKGLYKDIYSELMNPTNTPNILKYAIMEPWVKRSWYTTPSGHIKKMHLFRWRRQNEFNPAPSQHTHLH